MYIVYESPGAYSRVFGVTNEELHAMHEAGFGCTDGGGDGDGGGVDVHLTKPTGAIRISYGYYSILDDV